MSQKTTTPQIPLNGQILFDRPNCLFVGRIVEVRPKAVKVDYELQPISVRGYHNTTVYSYTCWIPVSVLIQDQKHSFSFEVKKWFANTFKGGYKIKNYMLGKNSNPVFV